MGSEVSELLPELTLAQLWDLTATELARNVHTHPTLGEGLQECFHALTGEAMTAPWSRSAPQARFVVGLSPG